MSIAARQSSAEPKAPSSRLDNEIAKFERMADEWWDPLGKFKPLHVFNPTRLAHIRNEVSRHLGVERTAQRPFEGLRLADIGCGGGLVSEPMARLGASVTGVDASSVNIEVAKVHAAQSQLDIDYRCTTAEQLLADSAPRFDVVLALEIVEHVADPDAFLSSCAQLTKPGGVMILATINRTAKAFALAIVGAEYVLRWLPRGTHDFQKLVKPDEARTPLERQGMLVERPVGMSYNPLTGAWSISTDTSVNYLMTATRPSASTAA